MNLSKKTTIAIIDSGIGGISILKSLIQKFQCGNYIYFADNLQMPYGNKNKQFVKDRVEEIIKTLQTQYNANYIIVACNTASVAIAPEDNVLTLTFDKNKTYLATPLTQNMLKGYHVIADESLALEIEKNILNSQNIKSIVKKHIFELDINNIKDLCLGCTHYELIQDYFKQLLPNTEITRNSDDLINKITIPEQQTLNIIYLSSLQSKSYIDLLRTITFS